MLGVPWALAFAEEQQVAEMEKEMRARELGSEVRLAKTLPTNHLLTHLVALEPATIHHRAAPGPARRRQASSVNTFQKIATEVKRTEVH